MDKRSDYVPRRYHDQQVTALTDRCAAAESAIRALVLLIDGDLMLRHAYDWQAAVKELLA
jgi:hypothetical protein